jgi:hypothetical protein
LPEPEKGLGDYVLVRATNSPPKFDLDFAGGTPKDLVKAIKAQQRRQRSFLRIWLSLHSWSCFQQP